MQAVLLLLGGALAVLRLMQFLRPCKPAQPCMSLCLSRRLTSCFPGDQFFLSFLGDGALDGAREALCEGGRGSEKAKGKSAGASAWLDSTCPGVCARQVHPSRWASNAWALRHLCEAAAIPFVLGQESRSNIGELDKA